MTYPHWRSRLAERVPDHPGGHGDEDHPLRRVNRLKRYVFPQLAQATGTIVSSIQAPSPIPRLHLDRGDSRHRSNERGRGEVSKDLFATTRASRSVRRARRPSRARLDPPDVPRSHARPLSSATLKIAPENLQEVIENYAGFRDAMREAGYEKLHPELTGGVQRVSCGSIADHGDPERESLSESIRSTHQDTAGGRHPRPGPAGDHVDARGRHWIIRAG